MDQQPQRGEICEGIAFKNAAQVGLNIGWTREASVTANKANTAPVRAKAPESVFTGVEPVLDGRCGRTPAPICRKMSARVIEIVGRRHDHDRHTAVESFERNRKLALALSAYADATHIISKAEHVMKDL